jgi:hypothetical protein
MLHKLVSLIFHPVLLPFAGTLYYFLIHPIHIPRELKYKITIVIITGTYLMPLLLLYILKKRKKINSYELSNISERKTPLLFMIALFFILGKSLLKIEEILELGTLFIGCSCALTICYFLFLFNFKTSIHMIGASSMLAFVILFSMQYQQNMLAQIAVIILFSGLIGQARLHLKAHTAREVYFGFLIGIMSQFIVFGLYY